MNVIMNMFQSANIKQRIMAQWPPTSGVPTCAFASGAVIALRDHGQATHW